MELSPLANTAMIAGVGFLLFIFLWYVTSDFPRGAKIVARLILLCVAALPLGLGLLTTLHMPRHAERSASAPASPPEEFGRVAPQQDQADREQSARRAPIPPPPPASAPKPSMRAPESAAPSPQDSAAPSPAPGARTEAQPPAAAPSTPDEWDIVPVFYGTDRNRSTEQPRVEYGSDRARRLQLGHALVTVPKSHQVPQVERPWVYTIPFTSIVIWQETEDPKKHFTMKDIREVSREEFLELVRKRLADSNQFKDHALVFVHGFNTSFDYAVYRTAQIAYDLKFDGAPFLYSWPSKGQFGVQDYSYDRESSTAAEPYLKSFLEMVARESGAKSISIIAHSMGNQLLLPVLRDLRRSTPPDIKISQVILAAPDVDRDNFEFLAREIQGISDGVTLFVASNDRAMIASRQFWGGVPRAGDVPTGGPIILPGIDTIDVTGINTDIWSMNHSGYAETTTLLDDIQQLIKTGKRPPKSRVPTLQEITTTNGGLFWRYPAAQ